MNLCKSAATVAIFPLFFLWVRVAEPAESISTRSMLMGKTVHRIEYVSDVPLQADHYDPYLGIRIGERLTPAAIKASIQFLYASGRFSGISAEALPEGDGAVLRFHLRHNYYFNRFALAGKLDLKGRALGEWVSLPVGERYTGEKLEEARQAVLKFLHERGFYGARVQSRTTVDEGTRQLDTIFEVQPGELARIRSVETGGVPSGIRKAMLKRLQFQSGRQYDRSRLPQRLENLKKYLFDKGYLAATVQVSESYHPDTHEVSLTVTGGNFGRIRVAVDGYKIDRNQLRRLLPALSGQGITPEIVEEGADNLKKYLENLGYAEAEVLVHETEEASGMRVFRYRIHPRRKFAVAFIRFAGNRAVSSRDLLESIAAVFQNSGYSAGHLEDAVEALQSLYASRGHLHAAITPHIEPLKDGTKLGITFECRELLPAHIRSLKIEGNTAISTESLCRRLQLAPGAPYAPALMEQARQSLLAAYGDLGYLQAQVFVHADDADAANAYQVEFRIAEGAQSFVDRVFILGNERTRQSVIRKRIRIKEHEPLGLSRMLQTQQGLYSLGVFDQVRVAPQNPESSAPHQDVVIRLQESKRYTMRYGVGYQEREKLRGTLEFSDLNFLGVARRADVRLRGSSIEQQVLFNLKQPQFRTVPVESYFTFSALQRRDVSFDSRRFSLSYQFSHPFGSHAWGMLRYNFKNVRILKSLVPTSELGREDEPVNLSTFSAAIIRDTRDDFLDPTRGFFSSTDFGITTRLLGDNNYVTFYSQNSYFHPLPKALLLAASVRLGAAQPYGGDGAIPISERFFAGGGSSLRGFDTDYAGPLDPLSNKPLGGNALVLGSLEMRFPLFRFLHVAGFFDSGNVFRTLHEVQASGFSHTAGAGLRIRTPFGPLRADYGYNLNLPADLQQRGLKRGHLFITVGPPF